MNDRPVAPSVQFDALPEDLRETPRWVLWKYLSRQKPDGTKVWAKVPLSFRGRAARSTDPATWTDFDRARRTAESGRFDGVGFVFDGKDGLVGIDLDDCVNVLGNFSAMAADLLDSVPGYAEISPSGNGIKMWTRVSTPMASFEKKTPEGDLEFYSWGRYFTCTGAVIDGSDSIPELPIDALLQAWFRRWTGEALQSVGLGDDDDELDLTSLRNPVDEFTLERVADEILSRLDPDAEYNHWLQVGMALHHQFEGSDEALELWDDWSQGSDSKPSSKYTEGSTSEKWDTFSEQRAGGRGAVTLRSLIKEAGVQSVASSKDRIADAIAKINAVDNAAELEGPIAERLKKAKLSELEREQLVEALRRRMKELTGTMMPVATVRKWIKPDRNNRPFIHTSEKGHPLGTIENVQEILERMSAVVRYNVISKEAEVLVPDTSFTLDNFANASIAMVISKCAEFEVPQGNVPMYLVTIGDKNQFNPVMTWIDSKPWDKTDRLQALLETVSVRPEDVEQKNKLIRMWLIGAVAIANNDGSEFFRNVLTFQGAQYQGKTTWLRNLVPSEMNLVRVGVKMKVEDKDFVKRAVSCWLLELGELDSTFDRSHAGDLKAWIASPVDIWRPPYAKTEATFPRRTAIFASVNKEEFLLDETGNTRFWVIHTLAINTAHGIDMQQLWAQVATLWRAGERWFLDNDEMKVLEVNNERFLNHSPIEDMLLRAFSWPELGAPIPKARWMSAVEALQEIGVSRPSTSEARQAAVALARLTGANLDDSMRRTTTRGAKLFPLPAKVIADTNFEDEVPF